MGCDIHLVVEKRKSDKWVAVDALKSHYSTDGNWSNSVALQRNYNRFAKLANVRGEGIAAKGVPEDVSETAKFLIEEWGLDGHSHTWHWLRDAAQIFKNTDHKQESDLQSSHPEYYYFNVEVSDENDIDDYRVIMWFDN